MARRKRDGKLAMVRMSWNAYNELFSFCDYSSFDFTAVAGGIISRHYKEVLTMMPDEDTAAIADASKNGPAKNAEGDDARARRTADDIRSRRRVTEEDWHWLNRYEKSRGLPETLTYPASTDVKPAVKPVVDAVNGDRRSDEDKEREDWNRGLAIRDAIKEGHPVKEEQWVWLHEYQRAKGFPLTQRPLPYKPVKSAEPAEPEIDHDTLYANKLYNSIERGQDLTPEHWKWLDHYRKSKGLPLMEIPGKKWTDLSST